MSLVNISQKIDKKIDQLNFQTSSKRVGSKKMRVRLLLALLVLMIVFGFAGVRIFFGVKSLKQDASALNNAYKAQNFDQMNQALGQVKADVGTINTYSIAFAWTRWIPLIGGYFGDGLDFLNAGVQELNAATVVFNSLAPYKQELGFVGTPVAGQDRIAQGIKILQKVLPNLNQVQGSLDSAAHDVANVDPNKYPDSFRGIPLKSLVQTGKELMIGASDTVKNHRQALEIVPNALGADSPKEYLLLFQNDKEIRATGGFMTAYATLKLDKGKISTDTSDDIYHLDEQLLKVCLSKICPLTPPAPIAKYLPEFDGKPRKAWSMRDSNLSPDVPTSAKEFETMYQYLGNGLPFNGIVYIDTQVVEELLRVIGPIDVDGTKYSAENDPRCNCANIIYELEHYSEVAAQGASDRKAILGVLMQQVMARALGADVQKLPVLMQTVISLANNKHILFFMHDPAVQTAVSGLGWTGEIKPYSGDYLAINDSNFAGGKSNLYVVQTVTQEIKTNQNGKTIKKLTIEYKNPQPFNTWLNGINRDYVRIYVSQGSKLISSKGSNDKVNTFDELGKTVFDAFITVNPQNYRVLEFDYEIPYNPTGKYDLLIQKQPGAKDFIYKTNINGRPEPDVTLDTDKELKFGI